MIVYLLYTQNYTPRKKESQCIARGSGYVLVFNYRHSYYFFFHSYTFFLFHCSSSPFVQGCYEVTKLLISRKPGMKLVPFFLLKHIHVSPLTVYVGDIWMSVLHQKGTLWIGLEETAGIGKKLKNIFHEKKKT